MNNGTAILGAFTLIILAISIPIVVFLSAYVGVQIITLILAGKYWASFWWCWLYGLFPFVNGVLQASNK